MILWNIKCVIKESLYPYYFKDGTANCLQHYAALMRDEKLASAVNLISSEAPQDIY